MVSCWVRLPPALAPVPNCQPCRTSVYVPWSYAVLDTEDDFEDFKALLTSETDKRGFSEAAVASLGDQSGSIDSQQISHSVVSDPFA